MKTYTPQHRDAPATPRDLMVQARKQGQWSVAMDLVQAEAFRLGLFADMTKAPLWLLDELASVFIGTKQFSEAQPVLQLLIAGLEAIPAERNNLVRSLDKMGRCCEVLGDFRAALLVYKRGTDLVRQGAEWKDDAKLWVGYGYSLNRMGRVSEGEAALRESLRRKCSSVEARYQRAQVKLALGMWEEGWAEYESRKELPDYLDGVKARGGVPNLPEWDGTAKGQVLCIMGQGAGDVIQFYRYTRAIQERIVVAPMLAAGEPLREFLGRSPWRDAAFYVHLDSVPWLLRLHDPIPPSDDVWPKWSRPSPLYLPFDRPNRLPRVGVCWKGSSQHLNDKDRSCPFDPRPLLQDDRWDVVSVQHGEDFSPKDYQETAEFLRTLDAVVTVDTSTAHVAGTLGAPTVLIPPAGGEWRWQLRGDTAVWYPSMTLVRRKTVYDWPDAWRRAKTQLAETLR